MIVNTLLRSSPLREEGCFVSQFEAIQSIMDAKAWRQECAAEGAGSSPHISVEQEVGYKISRPTSSSEGLPPKGSTAFQNMHKGLSTFQNNATKC